MYVVSSMRAYLCNALLTWHFFPDSVSPQLVLQFLLLIGVDYTVTAVGTVLTWLCCMVSWFPVGLLHDAKRLQRQWFPGRSASYRYHSTACSFFHLPRDFMESLASLVSGWGLSRGWGNVGRVEGSGNWICVYLQRICAVAGKWTYNLTCLTNAFKRFSSYFPQHRDQSCRLFSPPLCLSLSTYSHSSPWWYSFSYSVSVGFAFPFCVSLCKSLNSVFWFNLQFDCNRYQSAGAKTFYQWVSEREMRLLSVLDTTRTTVNWGLAMVNWNPTRSTKWRRLANGHWQCDCQLGG